MPKQFTKAGQTAHLEGNRFFDIVASNTINVEQIGANFHVNKTGIYNLLLTGNTDPKKVFLIAGMPYPYRIRRLYVTDTDNVDGLVGVDSVGVSDDDA